MYIITKDLVPTTESCMYNFTLIDSVEPMKTMYND